MKRLVLGTAGVIAAFGFSAHAFAQKEAIGMFYELRMAPTVCKWSNAGDGKKLDATIVAQESALGVTASDRADLMKRAEADLRSDPSNCAADGMIRPMYDEAIK